MMTRYLWLPLTLPVLAGCHISSVSFERMEQREIETTPLTTVSVDTFNGGIEVATHDRPYVDLEVTYRASGSSREEAEANCSELDCDVQAEDGKLIIKATKPARQWSSAATFKLKIPTRCDLEMRSSNGKLVAQGIEGTVTAQSSNGEIHLTGIAGQAVARTSNGRVHLNQVYGPIDIETSNGRVSYTGLPMGRDNRIRTSNGRVEIHLPTDALVELHSQTSNGQINCQLPVSEVFEKSKREWSGLIGPADAGRVPSQSEVAKLAVRTSNGSITIGPIANTPQPESQPAEEIQPPAVTVGEISDEITL